MAARLRWGLVGLWLGAVGWRAFAADLAPAEAARRDRWLASLSDDRAPGPSSRGPLARLGSLRLAGEPWPTPAVRAAREVRSEPLPWGGERRVIRYRDPDRGLELEVSARVFADYPAVEWIGRLAYRGAGDSPWIEGIQALDEGFEFGDGERPRLHWAKGGVASFDDFSPQVAELAEGRPVSFAPRDGRSSSEVLPFFNLAGPKGGVVLALGWSGGWAAEFDASSSTTVRVRAGMARTRLRLHPGEEIRTPSALALFYEGDRWRGQNQLRRFLLRHHRPQRDGRPLTAPITCGNWGGTRAAVHLDNIARIVEQRLPVEYYWIDAEWYGAGAWPVSVGDWTPKSDLYPEGFRPLSQALRASGRELMLWFEPERVHRGTAWDREHPGWLLRRGGASALLNLGHPEALAFVTRFIGDRVAEYGLGCYRQDFNMDPAPFWAEADAPERQGMTEIRHVEGLYAFWDGLRARHPGLILDNCASGGRRIDLETVGRATPFWRTDGPRDPIAHQCHSFGLSMWVPFSATSQDRAGDDYEFRSSMSSALCLNWWVSGDVPAEPIRADFPFDWARRTLEQYLAFRDCFEGDYYPLSDYSQARDVWMAYQFDLPEKGTGLVVALRRPDCPEATARFALRGLDPAAGYVVTDLDAGSRQTVPGRVLLGQGLTVRVEPRPGSALFVYRRQP